MLPSPAGPVYGSCLDDRRRRSGVGPRLAPATAVGRALTGDVAESVLGAQLGSVIARESAGAPSAATNSSWDDEVDTSTLRLTVRRAGTITFASGTSLLEMT